MNASQLLEAVMKAFAQLKPRKPSEAHSKMLLILPLPGWKGQYTYGKRPRRARTKAREGTDRMNCHTHE